MNGSRTSQVLSRIARFLTLATLPACFLLHPDRAAAKTVEITYPGPNELIQLGEACKMVLRPVKGEFGKTKQIDYLLTGPGQPTKVVHSATDPSSKKGFQFGPFPDAGDYALGIRVTLKDGSTYEESVPIRVGTGQYRLWPEYDYTELSDLEKIIPEPWIDHDHVKPGWDWSLPDFVTPAPGSAIALERRFHLNGRFQKPNYQFPVNTVGSLWVRWRDLEPVEGQIDFSKLEEVIRDAKAKGVEVALRILFSRKGKRIGQDADGKPQYDTSRAFAPDWLADKGIKLIEYENGEFESGDVDYDPLDPVFHSFYTRFVEKLGQSAIPGLLAYNYVGYASESYGDEYIGPEVPKGEDPARVYPVVKERLNAWASAFKDHPGKLYMGGPSQHGFDLGFGIRRGFVEKYLYEIPDEPLGSSIDPRGYLTIDETARVHRDGLINGEENEEYEEVWTQSERKSRFGFTTASFPYRYFMSSLRMLQMRCNYVLTGSGHLIKGMLPFIARELGRTVEDTPDVWALLNTGYIRAPYYQWNETRNPPRSLTEQEEQTGILESKNFERWLHQRDEPGYETQPRIKVNQPHEMWMVPDDKPYDFIARGGKKIGFHIDDRWLKRNHVSRLAIKVTFLDSEEIKQQAADGTLVLNYQSNGETVAVPVSLMGGDELRTATVFVDKIDPNAMAHGFDFTVEAGNGAPEVVVSMVRVIQADKPGNPTRTL